MDLIAACIAFFSVRQSAKPADNDHAFGHGKFESFSGLIEAILIFFAALLIIWEAVSNHIYPEKSTMDYTGTPVFKEKGYVFSRP